MTSKMIQLGGGGMVVVDVYPPIRWHPIGFVPIAGKPVYARKIVLDLPFMRKGNIALWQPFYHLADEFCRCKQIIIL